MDDATQPTTADNGHPPAISTRDLTGTTLGEFHILRRLGQGGMGQVYLAEQSSLRRKVAMKFLRPDLAADPKAVERFDREAKSVASVTHANIVQVYAIGAAEGLHYMVLEYVEGRNLREYINRKGPPELPVALTIMRQVAAALQKASETGIVHRDIKPENILLTRKGEVKVADFGLSRVFAAEQDVNLTQSGMTLGTPIYMSPEQVQAKPLDPRSDIYSFGVTCYHMLAGEPPFKGATAFEVALQHVQGEAPTLQQVRPDLPADLCALVQRMMSKDPDKRPQTGREILRELNPARGPIDASPFAGLSTTATSSSKRLQGVGEITSAPTEALPPANAFRGRRTVVFVGLSIVLAMAAGVGLRLWANARTPAAANAPRDDNPNLPIASERERQLLTAVEIYAKPPADRPNFIQVGASHHAELGMLYLEQKRYDEAEKFFEDMVKRPGTPWQYKRVGNLGLAITYAMRDEPVRSVKQFQDMRENPGAKGAVKAMLPPPFPLLEDVINMRYWILTALERNATHEELPAALRNLRNQLKNNPSGKGKGKGG